MAMQLFLLNPERYSHLILLAGHAGLNSERERQERERIESQFLEKIESFSCPDFFKYWNGLELFKFDDKLIAREFDKKIAAQYFERWGLSKQKYMKEDLLKYKKKIDWFFGAKDKKYLDYAKKELLSFNLSIIPRCGHRLIANETVKQRLTNICHP